MPVSDLRLTHSQSCMNQYRPFNRRTSSLADLELHKLGIVSLLKVESLDLVLCFHIKLIVYVWFMPEGVASVDMVSPKLCAVVNSLPKNHPGVHDFWDYLTSRPRFMGPRARNTQKTWPFWVREHINPSFRIARDWKSRSSVEKIFHVPCGILLNYFYCVFGPRLFTVVVWRTSTIVVDDDATVDRRNPAPAEMVDITLFSEFYTSRVMQDFFHQQ